MSANSIDCIILEAVLLGDQVVSVAFETLNQLSVTFLTRGQPSLLLHDVTIGVEGLERTSTTAFRRWNKEVNETTAHPSNGHSGTAEQDQVHDGSSLHVWNECVWVQRCLRHRNYGLSWEAPRFLNLVAVMSDGELVRSFVFIPHSGSSTNRSTIGREGSGHSRVWCALVLGNIHNALQSA